jgi:hypothetical protein
MFKFRIFVLLAIGASLEGSAFANKVDTIFFQNGDRITAEVKSMENNKLRLSTDDAGTITLEWDKVDSVKIINPMRIVLQNGEILYGLLLPAEESKGCYIWSREEEPRLTALETIVLLSPFEERILDRLSGILSSGFSYTKASSIMQINLNGSVKYLAEKNQLELYYDGIFTRESAGSSEYQNGGLNFRRILPRKWFLGSNLSAESSTEQQLDLRTSLSLGGGNGIIMTNHSQFYVAAALLGNREVSSGTDQYNIEGLLSLDYSIFIFDSPEVSLNIGGDLIPSISDLGRVRSRFDSNLKWEVFKDFYLKWTFFYSYDSKPLSKDGEKSDWAVSLVGLEYKL